ncbi:LLM class flavin-dependent oxidoreductase, partial [Microlunatus speluncae]|uniref:LLM class flavin-dependent oxidoreductase n=1 Tax=Microlunatus speluncae TaxID=2594267 RepID=UPI001266731D
FDSVWMSEHHLTDDGLLPSPLIMAAAIAARTHRIRIGTNIIPLPLHHPLRIAEDAAVADLISAGRMVLGLGQGYAKPEFAAFGADRRRRGSLLEEGIGILRRAWTTDGRFSFAGEHWSFDEVQVTPRPRRPLPIYVGAVTEPALRRAARIADGILVYCGKVSDLRARLGMIKNLGLELPVVATGILHVAPSAEQAWAEAAPGIAYLEGQIAKYGQRTHPEELNRDDYLVGAPGEVIEKLAALRAEFDVDHFAHWARLPGLSHSRCTETLELIAAELLA